MDQCIIIVFFEMYFFAKQTGCESTRKDLKVILHSADQYLKKVSDSYWHCLGGLWLSIAANKLFMEIWYGDVPKEEPTYRRMASERMAKQFPSFKSILRLLGLSGKEWDELEVRPVSPTIAAIATCCHSVGELGFRLGECSSKRFIPSLQSGVLLYILLTSKHFMRVLAVDWSNLQTAEVQVSSNLALREHVQDAIDKSNFLLGETEGLLVDTIEKIDIDKAHNYLNEIMPVARSFTLTLEAFTHSEMFFNTSLDLAELWNPFYGKE